MILRRSLLISSFIEPNLAAKNAIIKTKILTKPGALQDYRKWLRERERLLFDPTLVLQEWQTKR